MGMRVKESRMQKPNSDFVFLCIFLCFVKIKLSTGRIGSLIREDRIASTLKKKGMVDCEETDEYADGTCSPSELCDDWCFR